METIGPLQACTLTFTCPSHAFVHGNCMRQLVIFQILNYAHAEHLCVSYECDNTEYCS